MSDFLAAVVAKTAALLVEALVVRVVHFVVTSVFSRSVAPA
jgi:hypothetical protein